VARRRSLFLELVGAAALVAVLAGAGVGVANLRAARAALDEHLRLGLRRDSELIRDALSERIASACSLVTAAARDPDLREEGPATIQPELVRRIESAGLLANLYYYDPTGTLSAVAYHDGRDVERYLGRRIDEPVVGRDGRLVTAVNDAFDHTLRTEEPTFSRAFLDSEQQPMFVYAVPVPRAEGLAVLTSGIKGSDPRIQRMLDALRPAHGGFVAIVDPALGIVVRAGDPPEGLAMGARVGGPVAVSRGYLVAEAEEPRTGLVIVLGVPASASQDALGALSRQVLASTALAILAAALLAAVFARRLGVPLQALVEALRQVQRGAYAHRIEVEAEGELGEAVEAFNDMAGRLQRSRVIERVWSETWDA